MPATKFAIKKTVCKFPIADVETVEYIKHWYCPVTQWAIVKAQEGVPTSDPGDLWWLPVCVLTIVSGGMEHGLGSGHWDFSDQEYSVVTTGGVRLHFNCSPRPGCKEAPHYCVQNILWHSCVAFSEWWKDTTLHPVILWKQFKQWQ